MVILRVVIALICCGCAFANERTVFEEKTTGFRLKKHTENLNAQDHSKYASWILEKHPSKAKKALLTATLTSTYYPSTPTITWYKACLDASDFTVFLDQTYHSPSVATSTTQGYYDYTPNGAFWVDFANGQHFGGGFRSSGNVQEERMFDEFPQLANLAYVLRKNTSILPSTKNGDAEPFLVVSALRKFDVSQVPYGKALDSTSPKKVTSDVIRLNKPFTFAHIIGLAAKNYNTDHNPKISKHDPQYSMSDIEYHLKAALLGDLAARQYNGPSNLIIHTGRWGAGAFKNSVSMITALQILAAEMAFGGISPLPQLVFHGIDPSLVTSLHEEIVHHLQSGKTPYQLLKVYKARQDTDPSWRPQS